MCLFTKIKNIIISAFLSLMVNFSAFSSDIKLEETTPMSVASSRIMSGAPNEIGKVGIGERHTSEPSNAYLDRQDTIAVKIKKSSRISKPIMESVSSESTAAEIPAPLPLTIYFHSNHTNTIYQVDDFIGKPIGEYIKKLTKDGRLVREDRALYYYDFSISCNPELPKDVLADLGIGSLTRKIVITESLSQQLSLHSCTLSFSFKEQTVLLTKQEQDRIHKLIDPAFLSSIHPMSPPAEKKFWQKTRHDNLLKENAEKKAIQECMARHFFTRNTSESTTTPILHLGYTLVKIEGKAVITPEGSPDALLHGTNN